MQTLGFSTIFFGSLNEDQKEQIENQFELFDISPIHLGSIAPKNTVSVQSIFFGHDVSRMSLVDDDYSFQLLFNLYKNIVDQLEKHDYKSLIFGSPSLRKIKDISIFNAEITFNRYKQLYDYSSEKNILLYMEALPKEMCDYINNHEELIAFTKRLTERPQIHIDFATMLSNGENINLLRDNISIINRYHISVPNYSYNFTDYPIIKTWINFLSRYKVNGIIEIQKISENTNLIKEIEWLTREI